MNLFILVLIAFSLSMDAFSMSLAYGTLNTSKKEIFTLSLIVGIYHFIMPLVGNITGKFILNILPVNTNLLVFFILILIGIEMIIDTIKNDSSIKKMKFVQMVLFGFTVSIDSFSVGIGLNDITSSIILSSIIFSIFSFLFTYFGALIGNKINKLFGSISTMIGGAVLILIAFLYII